MGSGLVGFGAAWRRGSVVPGAILNVVQCRMARPALGWTLNYLAASGVSRRTIARFEARESVLPPRVQKLREAIETYGILFIDSGHLAGGVIPSRTS